MPFQYTETAKLFMLFANELEAHTHTGQGALASDDGGGHPEGYLADFDLGVGTRSDEPDGGDTGSEAMRHFSGNDILVPPPGVPDFVEEQGRRLAVTEPQRVASAPETIRLLHSDRSRDRGPGGE